MLISFYEYPQEYKYLEHIDNTKMYLFIDNNATTEEKANIKKYDQKGKFSEEVIRKPQKLMHLGPWRNIPHSTRTFPRGTSVSFVRSWSD